jgi:prepilin-type N-terminal cleavage/methylation domain-containing protein
MNKKSSFMQLKKERTRAFTLLEIMFATVILGIIGTILTSFMINAARGMSWSIDKSLITNDFRKFTNRITQDTYNANFAYLYTDFTAANASQSIDRLAVGSSGDCLVLVQTEPFPNANSQRFFRRIVVYYRVPGEVSPVFRQEVVFDRPLANSTANNGNTPNPTPDPDYFENFLIAQITNLSPPQTVLQSTRGLSGISSNQFFERLTSEAFLITGEIINGVNSPSTTNTYNLTISTRG